ncbi:hypothetical protein IW147_004001 [Coemansia sp. RSA 720]|nr:hypothetical protein LPJ76_005231 [Coemansia sp. RSA 638]KAJ2121754.1 hypothetical protein IW147_004001 [Coemansia sp. RSA 720]KAJ2540334.1 hypothetical protein GGF49_004543 [Coemansia sp. RSA 1853]
MKFSALSIGLIAAFSGAGHAAPVTDYGNCVNAIVMQLISLFQTGSTAQNFANCGKDDDGSGYASGIINFTTRNGDALKVIKAYMTNSDYKGEFDDYMDTLEEYADSGSKSTKNLDGYCDAWKTASENTAFWSAQTSVVYNEYNAPTQEYVDEIGIKFSVTRAVLYDTAIVDGIGSGKSSLGGIFKATNAVFKSDVTGSSGNSVTVNDKYEVDEYVWLQKFLDIREQKSSAGRKNIEAYRSIVTRNDLNWSDSVTVTDSDGDDVVIKCNYIES